MTLTYADYENTYWNNRGKHNNDYDVLHQLVPYEGKADSFHIEWLRAISNIYYDFYNNGWCNWDNHTESRAIIARAFGASWLADSVAPESSKEIVDHLESLVDLIIVAVKAIEQELHPLTLET